jgi:hypothetical protein
MPHNEPIKLKQIQLDSLVIFQGFQGEEQFQKDFDDLWKLLKQSPKKYQGSITSDELQRLYGLLDDNQYTDYLITQIQQVFKVVDGLENPDVFITEEPYKISNSTLPILTIKQFLERQKLEDSIRGKSILYAEEDQENLFSERVKEQEIAQDTFEVNYLDNQDSYINSSDPLNQYQLEKRNFNKNSVDFYFDTLNKSYSNLSGSNSEFSRDIEGSIQFPLPTNFYENTIFPSSYIQIQNLQDGDSV